MQNTFNCIVFPLLDFFRCFLCMVPSTLLFINKSSFDSWTGSSLLVALLLVTDKKQLKLFNQHTQSNKSNGQTLKCLFVNFCFWWDSRVFRISRAHFRCFIVTQTKKNDEINVHQLIVFLFFSSSVSIVGSYNPRRRRCCCRCSRCCRVVFLTVLMHCKWLALKFLAQTNRRERVSVSLLNQF